jgi:hypothetical protein
MSAPAFNTWEGGTGAEGTELPRRPSTDDLGGDAKQDNNEAPPDDVEHFTAAGWNQLVKQVAALARVTPACVLEIRFSSGTPYVARCSAASGVVNLATFGTPTDNGTGDTTILWPANTFPPAVLSPSGLTLLVTTSADRAGDVEEVSNGIRVRTKAGGVATDIPFTIQIWGQ